VTSSAPHRRRRHARDAVPYEFKPHERPMMPGSPATPDHPTSRRLAYLAIGVLFGLTAGFANGLLAASSQLLQGALGLSSVEAGWLTAAYSMTSVCTSMLLVKFRQQFGVTLFARIFLPAFAIVCLAQLLFRTFELELMLRGFSGIVASGMTSFCLFYVIQGLPAKMRLAGMAIGIGLTQLGLPLSRVIAPLLLGAGDIQHLFAFELGLALICLACAGVLPLPPSNTMRAFERLDLLTFAFLAPGMALLCGVFAQVRLVWWSAPWIGYALAGAAVLIATALLIEHNRANPLLNIRWLASTEILQFAALAATMRIFLAEQNFGSIALFTTLGLVPEQLVRFYLLVTVASVAGLAASIVRLNPQDLLRPIVTSALLIAIGAWMDSNSTSVTRPVNLYVSQSLIAFASLYFVGPLMMTGMLRALPKGPSHLVSFTAVFSISQTLGGLGGSALLGSLQVARERLHSNELVQDILFTDPQAVARVTALSGAYARVLTDPVLRQAEGMVLLGQQVAREANVLAYNDVFRMIAWLATVGFLLLLARWVYYRVHKINPLAGELAALQKMRAAQSNG
jgi:hypothetical protein